MNSLSRPGRVYTMRLDDCLGWVHVGLRCEADRAGFACRHMKIAHAEMLAASPQVEGLPRLLKQYAGSNDDE